MSCTNSPAKFVESNRGKNLITYGKSLFRRRSGHNGKSYWVCNLNKVVGCKAKLHVLENQSEQPNVLKLTGQHNHRVDLDISVLKTEIKEAAKQANLTDTSLLSGSISSLSDTDSNHTRSPGGEILGNHTEDITEAQTEEASHTCAPVEYEGRTTISTSNLIKSSRISSEITKRALKTRLHNRASDEHSHIMGKKRRFKEGNTFRNGMLNSDDYGNEDLLENMVDNNHCCQHEALLAVYQVKLEELLEENKDLQRKNNNLRRILENQRNIPDLLAVVKGFCQAHQNYSATDPISETIRVEVATESNLQERDPANQ